MVCLALNVRLVGKSLNPYLPVVEYPDASNGLFSLTSCVGPTSFCLPHSLLSSVCFFLLRFAIRVVRIMHGNPSVLDVNALVRRSRVKGISKEAAPHSICDHHTSMYLQMRAPTPTVQSCGKCILHTRKSVAYATPPPPVPTPIETFIV